VTVTVVLTASLVIEMPRQSDRETVMVTSATMSVTGCVPPAEMPWAVTVRGRTWKKDTPISRASRASDVPVA
jgi:hypothetical protein